MLKQIYLTDTAKIFKTVLPPVGVNTYLLYLEKDLFIVDPGIGSSRLPEQIDIPYDEIVLLITHSHFDHISGIDEFPHSEIIISNVALPGLTDPTINLSGDFGGGTTVVQNKNILSVKPGKTVFRNHIFEVMVYPGHTQGDTVFDFGPFLFTGDFIFCNSVGRTDFRFSDNDEMKKSIVKFREYLSTKDLDHLILPGHMETCTVKKLLDKNHFLSVY